MGARLAGGLVPVLKTNVRRTGMSFRNKGRKFRPVSGKTFPKSPDNIEQAADQDFRAVVAETLREAFGGTGRSVKTVMAYTGAGERTVKNWFEGKNGPNGENLIELMRHSDHVLEAVLLISGREEILAGKLLVDARNKLVEMLEIIDQLQVDSPVVEAPRD
jgi:hypothetical protein